MDCENESSEQFGLDGVKKTPFVPTWFSPKPVGSAAGLDMLWLGEFMDFCFLPLIAANAPEGFVT